MVLPGVLQVVHSLFTCAWNETIAWLAWGWTVARGSEPGGERGGAGEAVGSAAEEAEGRELPEGAGEGDGLAEADAARWMRRAAGGDEVAWQRLFERWKLPLLSYFYRSLGSRAEAEDLTLEVFVRLHRAAPSYEPRARFSTFLFQIARNLLLNELRRRQRKPAEALPPEAFDYVAEGAAEEARGLRELEEVLHVALGRLPEKMRTALLFLQQQGLDYPEAAAAMGMKENALRVLVFRARQKLKEAMAAVVAAEAREEG